MEAERVKKLKGMLEVPYEWTYSKNVAEFFKNLKDKKILGSRCKNCHKVFVPPQVVCGICFSEMENNPIEVSQIGVVETYTVIEFTYIAQILPPPYAVGIIKLEGTSTRLNHLINKESLEKLKIGSRVRPIWRDKRDGSFFDIEYFEVIE